MFTYCLKCRRNTESKYPKFISNKELAEKLQTPLVRKFEKRKVHLSFINNILGAHLADMKLISKFNKGFTFLLCVIDI